MSTAATPPKVNDLLLPGEEPPPALTQAVGEAAKLEGVDGALARLTPIGLDILGARVGRLVGELLNMDLGSVVGSALTKNRAIADALRSTAEKPGAESVVSLTDHTLTSAYSPAVDIVVDAATVASIPFKVVLATTIEGGLLVIRGGHMVAVRAGRVKLSASLACEGVRIAEHEAELDLPAVMGLPAADAPLGAVVTDPAGAGVPQPGAPKEPGATEPAAVQKPAGWPSAEPPKGLAVASLVCGISGILLSWILLGIPSILAVIFGHIALSRAKQGAGSGRGLAIAGLIIGYVIIVIAALLLLGFAISMAVG